MKKAVVLVVVIGVSMIVSLLAFVVILVMTNEANIAEHKIRRMRGTFAVQGAIVHALERLRIEGTSPATIAAINAAVVKVSGTDVVITVVPIPNGTPSDYKVDAKVIYSN